MAEEHAEYKTEHKQPSAMEELTIAEICITIAKSEVLQDAHGCCPSPREIFSWSYQKPLLWFISNYVAATLKLQQEDRYALEKEFDDLTDEEKRLRKKLDAVGDNV